MKINYILCLILSILRFADIIFTYILINFFGFIETNPLGFNFLSISLILLWIVLMWVLSYYIKNKIYENILFFVILFFCTISCVVVGYEIKLLIEIL